MFLSLLLGCLYFGVTATTYPEYIPIDEGFNNHRVIPSQTVMYITTHVGYPAVRYRNNIDSSITLTGVSQYSLIRLETVIWSTIELESSCSDFLEVIGLKGYKNNTKRLCYSQRDSLIMYLHVLEDSLTFRFVSDIDINYGGVLLKYCEVFPIDVGGVFDRRNFSIDPIYIATHHRYPSVYSDNINSAWTLTNIPSDSVIRLKFSAKSGIALESNCHDYLNITGVSGYENNTLQICGTNVHKSALYLKPTTGSLSFRFVSDYNQGYTGFVLEYSEVDEIWSNERNPSPDNEVVPIQQGINTTARIQAKSVMHIVTHKGYPTIPYDNSVNSSLHLIGLSAQLLYRITVTARSGIELENNCSDYIASLENNLGFDSLCASDVDESTYYLTPFDSTTLTFITSQEETYKGLLLVYSDIPINAQIRLDFTAQTNIALEGNCFDYLNITGVTGYGNNVAQICGTNAPRTTLYLKTTGDGVTFRFFTDEVEAFAGFVMEFSVTYLSETTEAASTTVAYSKSPLVTMDTAVSATPTYISFLTVISLLILIIITLSALLAVLRRKVTLSNRGASAAALICDELNTMEGKEKQRRLTVLTRPLPKINIDDQLSKSAIDEDDGDAPYVDRLTEQGDLSINKEDERWVTEQDTSEMTEIDVPGKTEQGEPIVMRQCEPGMTEQGEPEVTEQGEPGVTEQGESGVTKQSDIGVTEQGETNVTEPGVGTQSESAVFYEEILP
ncbi:uncharacterized protein [Watersipora subatra]|uniref:uncharacterized protein n=1 Tax=Watersipora subatra TaxID=2589382 RepID=UPI00355C0620